MSSSGDIRGNLLIVAAPSGGGKTSLVNALLAADEKLVLSVSHTTRAPRQGEKNGVQYHFVTRDEFMALADKEAFLEHALVFGYHYGTHGKSLEKQLVQGLDVILEIDWQGAMQIRDAFPDCRSVFILPPSLNALRQRLARRATDSEEVINRRMRDAQAEILHWQEFDFLVVNDDFDTALDNLRAILRSLRLGRAHQKKQYAALLAELLGNG